MLGCLTETLFKLWPYSFWKTSPKLISYKASGRKNVGETNFVIVEAYWNRAWTEIRQIHWLSIKNSFWQSDWLMLLQANFQTILLRSVYLFGMQTSETPYASLSWQSQIIFRFCIPSTKTSYHCLYSDYQHVLVAHWVISCDPTFLFHYKTVPVK